MKLKKMTTTTKVRKEFADAPSNAAGSLSPLVTASDQKNKT